MSPETIPETAPARGGLLNAAPTWLLLSLLVFHGAANVWWLERDHRPHVGDSAEHLLFARAYYDTLVDPELNIFGHIESFARVSTGVYPPLLHAIGALAAYAGDGSWNSFLITNTAIFLLLIASMYWLSRLVLTPPWSLASAFIAGFLPMLFGMSRQFLTDLLSALIVIWALGAMCRSDGFRHTGWVFVFALVNGLGFLARWTTCLYYLVPLALVLGRGLYLASSPRAVEPGPPHSLKLLAQNTAMALLISVIIPAPWYVPRISTMIESYKTFVSNDGADPFTKKRPYDAEPAAGPGPVGPAPPSPAPVEAPVTLDAGVVSLPALLGASLAADETDPLPEGGPYSQGVAWTTYPIYLINKGVFLPAFLVGLAGLGLALLRARENFNWLVFAGWLAGAYVVLTLFWVFRAPAPRYVTQMAPAVAPLCALALSTIPRPKARRVACGVFGALLVLQYVNMTFFPLGPLAKISIPVFGAHPYIARHGEPGLTVWRDTVEGGGALIGPPFNGLNWVDRALEGIGRIERERRYIAGHQANVVFAGGERSGIETGQRNHWPLADPLDPASRRVRRVINPYVPLSTARPPLVVTTRLVTRDGAWALDPSPALRWVAFVDIPCPSALEIDLGRLVKAAAFSVEFGSVETAPGAFEVQRWDAARGEYAPFEPPVRYDGGGQAFHFQPFIPTDVTRLRIAFDKTPEGRETTEVGPIEVYTFTPQPRPIVLGGARNTFAEIDEATLEIAQYVIVAEPYASLPEPRLEGPFERIDVFEANYIGYWDPRKFTVYARHWDRPTVGFENTPRLRVRVSEDSGEGRWDVPWWRLSHYTGPATARPAYDYWSARAPAWAEAELGGVYAIDAIEVVPYTWEKGVSAVSIEYRKPGTEEWDVLPLERATIDVPKHRPAPFTFFPKRYPPPWPEPLMMDAVRLVLFRGSQVEPERVYVASINIYGKPVETKAEPAP